MGTGFLFGAMEVFRSQPWPGGSVGWSIILYNRKVAFGPRSGSVQEATDSCFYLTSVFLSLSPHFLPPPPSPFPHSSRESVKDHILG